MELRSYRDVVYSELFGLILVIYSIGVLDRGKQEYQFDPALV